MAWPPKLKPHRAALEAAARPCVFVIPTKLVKKAGAVWASNLCGLPYAPKSWPLPKGMFLVAQLNFAEIPSLKGFPRKGILQFWVSDHGHGESRVTWHAAPKKDAALRTVEDYTRETGEFGDYDGFHRLAKPVQGFLPCEVRFLAADMIATAKS